MKGRLPAGSNPRPPSGLCQDTRAVQRVTLWGLGCNLGLSAVKFLFGILGASQALVADAVHSLSDSATDLVVIIGAPYWAAPADADHPYGHSRIETMITLVIGTVLGAVGLGLIYHALVTLAEPHPTAPGWLAFAAALVSIVSKEFLYRWTMRVGTRARSSALIANAWHHRSDAMSSVPVALAVAGTKLRPDLGFLDHVAASVVSVLILQAAWRILWPALNQLADIGATDEERDRLARLVTQTPGVKAIHALRTRHLGADLQVDLHVLVDPALTVREGHDIAGAVKHGLLEGAPNVIDVLVHIEPYEADSAGAVGS